jgi:spermidine synthase
MTGVGNAAMRYMQMFAWLPLALHAEPRRALLISYGAGNTAQALLSEPRLGRLTVVDVSPEILGVSPVMHGERDPLRDPRVQLVLEDGRHYLRMPGEQFDIITAEPPPPGIAGVVNLYTREYFLAVAARLAPGGLATYWLPVPQFRPEGARAVTRAFCEAFPDCTLWAGAQEDWILMGGRGFEGRPDAGHFSRLWRDPHSAPLLTAGGLESPLQLGAAFLADAGDLRRWYDGIPALTDDHPKRIAPAARAHRQMGEYSAWLRTDEARRRFRESPWVARHWPAQLAEPSLAFFAVQPALNGEIQPDPVRNLPHVDAVLRHTDLRVPVLWMLGSDLAEQEIVNRQLAGGYRAEYAYPLGVRALAERDYATAGRLFAEAAARSPARAGALAAYSLCRAGKVKQAKDVAGAGNLAPELRCWRG